MKGAKNIQRFLFNITSKSVLEIEHALIITNEILLGCIYKQSSNSSYFKIRFDKATTHFSEGHCNWTQCQQQVPLSEQAYAADDKHSAMASGFYLQSKWLVWFKIALSCNQAAAFIFKGFGGTRTHKQKSTLTRALIANVFVLELIHPAVNA